MLIMFISEQLLRYLIVIIDRKVVVAAWPEERGEEREAYKNDSVFIPTVYSMTWYRLIGLFDRYQTSNS